MASIDPNKLLPDPTPTLYDRKMGIKPGAFVQFNRCRNNAMVILYNFFNDCEPYASTFISSLAVQPLKHFKNAVLLFWVESNVFIGYAFVANS